MAHVQTYQPRLLPLRAADPFPASEAPAPVEKVAFGQLAPWRTLYDDGSKFPGGISWTNLLLIDYWTLRQRSAELFETNMYARGIVRRLVTNIINVGLHLEATPEEQILGYPDDGLADWSELTENRFGLWANNPKLCDQVEQNTFGSLQALMLQEALVVGDVLVTLRQDQRTGLPRLQLTNGALVQTPFGVEGRTTNKVVHGVELDSVGRQIAYWVMQPDGSAKRLPAFGEKSGRRLAWLVYGSDKRMDQVRGKPLLALAIQSLKEIDSFRDSTQRKANLLSQLVGFVTKSEDKPGTQPLTSGGAVRRGLSPAAAAAPGTPRNFNAVAQTPGLWIDELQHGEEPKAFQTNGTVESFGDFERAILQGVAWSYEIPPEILMLSFGKAYSASQAAVNEFKMFLHRVRTKFGDDVCQPVYTEWLLAETLNGKLQVERLLESWRDPELYDVFAAWVATDWSGHIKPAVDLTKMVKAIEEACRGGFTTRARACRELFGLKYSKVVKQLARENLQLKEANAPLFELEALAKPAAPVSDRATKPGGDDDSADEADDDDSADEEAA